MPADPDALFNELVVTPHTTEELTSLTQNLSADEAEVLAPAVLVEALEVVTPHGRTAPPEQRRRALLVAGMMCARLLAADVTP